MWSPKARCGRPGVFHLACTKTFQSKTHSRMRVQAVDERVVRADVTKRIKALGRQGKAKEAVAELASMAELGVQPDAQAATALLDACVRSRKIDTMESVYEELFGRPAALGGAPACTAPSPLG